MASVDNEPEYRRELKNIGSCIDLVIPADAPIIGLGQHPGSRTNDLPVRRDALFRREPQNIADTVVAQHPTVADYESIVGFDVAVNDLGMEFTQGRAFRAECCR